MNANHLRCFRSIVPLLALLPALMHCARATAEGDHDDHSHAEEVPVAVVTLWEQGYELFIEYPVPIAGEKTRFITHVSTLDTGQPRRDGGITFHLNPDSGSALDHEEPEIARDGIYLPELVFPEPGKWVVSVEIPGPEGSVTIALPPTRVYENEHDALHAETPDEFEGVSYLKEQQWRLGTLTELVTMQTLQATVRVPGVVKAMPGRSAMVTPPAAGILEPPEGRGLPELGQSVEAGELVALVRPPFSDFTVRVQEARAGVTRTELALERERLVLNRVKELFEQQARSERELEQAEFAVKLAEADAEAARQKLGSLQSAGVAFTESLQFELRAPISGHFHHLAATFGEFVDPEHPIVEILDPSLVLVEARPRIDQLHEVTDLRRPSFVHLRGSQGKDVPLLAERVRLLTSGDIVDSRTRTIPLFYEVANDEGILRIGQVLDVLLPAGEGHVMAVPHDSLVDDGGETTVYVQLGGETFERRPVVAGIRDGDLVQIVSGLRVGERVVSHGASTIRLQAAAGSVPAHHHH